MTIISKPNAGSIIAEEGIVSPEYQKFFDEVEETVNEIAEITGDATGDVVGPEDSGQDRIAVFSNLTGKLIKDGGQTIAEVITAGVAASGDVDGPGSSTPDNIATFSDGTGKLIKDSGIPSSDIVTPSSSNAFTNKAYDANGVGNNLSNIDIGNCIAASQAEAEGGTDNEKLLTSLRVGQAIAAQPSGGFPIFRGCLVNLTTAISIINATNVVLPWQAEDYDTNNVHDNVTNNTRLTVPTGIIRVRLSARFRWDNNTVGTRRVTITKNGSFNWAVGIGQEDLDAKTGINISSTITAVAIVTAGDFFEVFARQDSGGTINVQASVAWFQMEILQ